LPTPTSRLDRLFHITARGSTPKQEVVAGLTTFGAMAYIMAVNPAIMAIAGLPRHDMIITTIAAAICGTLLMAFGANLPIALAPAMSSNAIFAVTVVHQMHVSPAIAFTMILLGGLAFTILSLTRARQRIVQGFPLPVVHGIQFAIGIFIARIGMTTSGLVTPAPDGLRFGSLQDPAVLLGLAGLLLTIVIWRLRVPAGLLLAILLITMAGTFVTSGGHPVTTWPTRLMDWPNYPTHLLFPFDFTGFLSHLPLLIPITLYFLISDFFDATGTMMSVVSRTGLKDENGKPVLGRAAFAADGGASIIGSCLGTSTVSAYIESLVGAEAGGRTGLTALTVALLFLASSLFWPLITAIPAIATAPVLILVGLNMLRGLTTMGDLTAEDALTPLLMILVTVLTGSFVLALALGLILYTTLLAATRQFSRLTPMLLGLDVIFIVYLVLASRMGA